MGINREVAVLFSKPMNPASINVNSFIVEGATGTVAYDPINLACFMHEGCRGGLRRDEIVAMVLMAA